MRDLFAALPDDPAPPLADGYLGEVLRRGRRSVRRRRIGTAAAWTAVVLALVAVLLPGVPRPAGPAAPAHRPSLPDRFAGYSTLTSTVERSAPGRAIALYTFGNGETFNMFQSLVVGADADTYRRVDDMERHDLAMGLLSPDGTRVLVGDDRGATSELTLVDLTTGRRRSIGLGAPLGVRPLAWSPDGRYAAYSATALEPSDMSAGFSVETPVLDHGTLRLLDVETGRSTEIPAIKGPWTAAFAPGGARLAVQVAQDVHLLDLNGHEEGVVPIGAGRGLVAGVGWSPDGRFLATVPWVSGTSDHDSFITDNVDATFVPLDPATPTPSPLHDVARVLGWRDPDHAIAAAVNASGRLSLIEITLPTNERRVLSRFDAGSSCELGMQHCEVIDLQLAAGLLPDLDVRTARSPDRGPWPWLLRVPVAALLTTAAALTWFLMRRRARRAR
ncbi:WD40 repeat domain-containing protein [Dactylosporangium sp. NPDC049140]|uniref:WD40 repeat domain-containing protein n=1 Tax=Dactylosporangium sp. NPDC049140 TaxID=3155647 RepID=UPI0033F01657